MYKFLLSIFLFSFTFSLLASDSWLTLNEKFLKELPTQIYQVVSQNKDIYLIKINSSYIDLLAYKRSPNLGGFITHETREEGLDFLFKNFEKISLEIPKVKYYLNQENIIPKLLSQVKEENLVADIKKLSSFYNRHYQTQTGLDSQRWLKNKWFEITKNRNDIIIDELQHNFKQPSIILTIQGSVNPEEVIVIGGHGDSTAGWFGSSNQAPGADDNASGIAALTETLRVLIANNYQPSKTIKFISYAGEEGGLLGSKEIASIYKSQRVNVIGAFQLDMTNYKGSEKEIYLVSDYTNKKQNDFVGALIDTYVKVPWDYTKCGYGCSDHASWTSNGFPASFPFEAAAANSNPVIHSVKDILEGRATHTVSFVKLALAYVVEMGK